MIADFRNPVGKLDQTNQFGTGFSANTLLMSLCACMSWCMLMCIEWTVLCTAYVRCFTCRSLFWSNSLRVYCCKIVANLCHMNFLAAYIHVYPSHVDCDTDVMLACPLQYLNFPLVRMCMWHYTFTVHLWVTLSMYTLGDCSPTNGLVGEHGRKGLAACCCIRPGSANGLTDRQEEELR